MIKLIFLTNCRSIFAKCHRFSSQTSWHFSKNRSLSQSVFILAIIGHPHFLMSSNHLSSTGLQNKTIIVQLPMIDIRFWDFQNNAKNGDSVLSVDSGALCRKKPLQTKVANLFINILHHCACKCCYSLSAI